MSVIRFMPIALMVGLIHIISAAAILWEPAARDVTPLAFLRGLFPWPYAALLLAVAGVLALVACFATSHPRSRTWLLALQQVLLVIHAVSALSAIMTGSYPDGYSPGGGSAFILADQVWLLAICATHTAEYAMVVFSPPKEPSESLAS